MRPEQGSKPFVLLAEPSRLSSGVLELPNQIRRHAPRPRLPHRLPLTSAWRPWSNARSVHECPCRLPDQLNFALPDEVKRPPASEHSVSGPASGAAYAWAHPHPPSVARHYTGHKPERLRHAVVRPGYDRAVGNLQAVYYRAADGSEPVSDFIDGLDPKRQVVLDNQIDRLNMLAPAGPHLPFPHSSQVRGDLRELRCHHGRELYRVLDRRSQNLIILLHVFRKDTGAIPESEIRIAEDRWADFKTRMEALKRRPPRAAGHDVP
jgi:phage-related protein